jgi:hypothetical protein
VTSEGHGEARRVMPEGGARLAAPGTAVPIARRIEALEPLKALCAEISAAGG